MNSTQLALRSEEQIKPESVLFAIGGLTILAGLALSLLKKPRVEITDPPPIFIKSGSFIIDSDLGFRNAGPNNHPKRPKLNVYNGNAGPIKRVIINQVNERIVSDTTLPQRPIGYHYPNPNGLTISLWLQLYNETTNVWQPVTGDPDILIPLSNPLQLELPADLTKISNPNPGSNPNDHPRRKHKDKLVIKNPQNRDLIWRFGRIEIRDHNGNLFAPAITTINGDEYLISIWF